MDGPVVVEFLFYNRVVIYDFVLVPAILGHESVRDGHDSAGHNQSDDFLGFGLGPCQFVWSSLGGRVREWLAVHVKVEGVNQRLWCIVGVWPGESDFGA